MKIVFEFNGEPQVTFNGNRYSGLVAEEPSYTGGRVEGLMVDCREQDGKLEEGDVLYIEGHIDSVRSAFEQALQMLDWVEERWRAEFVEEKENARKCDVCKCYYDQRHKGSGHSDGHGMSCLGDGTMLIGEYQIELVRGDERIPWTVPSLLPGNKFMIVQRLGLDSETKSHVFEALENPFKTKTHWQVRVKRPGYE